MPKRTVLFNQLPWNGGLNTSVDPGMIQPNQLIQADNIVFDTSGARKKRLGIDQLAPLTTGAGDVIGLEDFWHEIASGKQQRIIAVKQTASAITPIAGEHVTRLLEDMLRTSPNDRIADGAEAERRLREILDGN